MNANAENNLEPLFPENLTPDALENHLGDLIRRYVRTRSPRVAQSVVHHIEALCNHPAFEGSAGDRCSYIRLKAHWLWLAGAVPERHSA